MSRQNIGISYLYILLTLLFGLAITTSAYAERDDDGGYGPGYMMMWTDPGGELKLSDEQREKIYNVQREMRKKQWNLMEQMHTMMNKVYPLMNADKRDTKAILEAFEPMFKMHQQMLKVQIETADRIDAILTADQRKSLNEWRGPGYGRGRGGMGPGMMGGGYNGHGMMGGYGGHGMMDGYGPGMMGGYGGMGMMGGYGGFGMMGGYGGRGMMDGYGPGMMGGYGGMGMMGGYGMDMMGVGPLGMLDLSDKKREKIYDIQRDMRKQQWSLMDAMFKDMGKVNTLMSADKRDTKAILEAYEPIYKLQRKMLENHIEAANRIDAVLSSAERKKLREWRKEAPQMMWGR